MKIALHSSIFQKMPVLLRLSIDTLAAIAPKFTERKTGKVERARILTPF
jgi:hypothetical protein